ncbi:MAG TPA: hypothetical protein VJB94_05845 [Candidatus Nanoarchaeia archaeon]|nr:hypothetical protein [Candidatus Nanoarchaeia archaeon]
MRCLVLAFETLDDLPTGWKKLKHIDAYGRSKVSGKLPKNIKVYNKFFETNNYKKGRYDLCFIKHPDPWGEPRNWMQAIAAIGEILKEFYQKMGRYINNKIPLRTL